MRIFKYTNEFRLLLVITLAISISSVAYAEIKKSDLDKNVVMTEKAALLSQVDTVSLYLSSDRVAFAPTLSKGGVIEVEATVLGWDLVSNRDELYGFVSRLIATFISVLEERLPIYAPAIAKTFNSDTDIAFDINAGAARTPVAEWKAGKWEWAAGGGEILTPLPLPGGAPDINEARAQPAGRKGCNCPARVRKK